jgi:uncharacterized protein (DUF2249 family)
MPLQTHQFSTPPFGAGPTVLPALAENASVIEAITRHHAALANELRILTAGVVDGARSGDYDLALSDLTKWFLTELLPHAHAEEVALYSAGSRLEDTRLLVDGMLAEHRALESLVTDLTYASDPFTVTATTAAAQALFMVHLAKENDLLLPALDAAAVDLGAALSGMREILGEESVPAELDVRSLPHSGRHEIIFARLDELGPGDTFVILNDHDPKPLRYQSEALWPGRFAWNYLETGPLQWRVEITRAH